MTKRDYSAVSALSTARWRLVRASPGIGANRKLIGEQSEGSIDVASPRPVASLIADSPIEVSGVTEVDNHDWWFISTVHLAEPAVLLCEGLTPPGAILIDGKCRVEVESMFLPVQCEVACGTHEIAIWCGSLSAALSRRHPRGRWRSTLVASQGMRWFRTSLIGRAPVYGGVPPVVGPWRPVTMLDSAWVDTWSVRITAASGDVEVRGTTVVRLGERFLERGGELRIVDAKGVLVASAPISIGRQEALENNHIRAEFSAEATVENPLRWWPHGYGEQELYELTIDIAGVSARRSIGFREVSVDRSDGGFTLGINGVDVFCRGVVWSPVDPTTLRADLASLRTQLETFRDAGANMVRVMAGFSYEQDEFYELCGELGLMVWQDAMLTTFDPPPEQDRIVCAELTHLIDSISGCPALVVISGGSETQQQPEMLGVSRESRSIPLIERTLRRLVEERANVPYVAASPSNPEDSPRELAIRPDIGVAHWFGVGGYLRALEDVKTANVRFAAESLAFAVPPSDEAIEAHFGSLRVVAHDPSWKAGIPRDRTAAWDFEDVRDFYVREIFDVDPMQVRRVDPPRYLQLGRLAIGEAMAACYRFWRRAESGCGGALILFARDLVPGAGWGLLDCDGNPKLPVALLARAWAPLALFLSDDGLAGMRIDIHNDGPEAVHGVLSLRAVDSVGNVVADGNVEAEVDPHGSSTFRDFELTGVFGDLSHAFRFGVAPASAIVVRFDTTDGRTLTDVHVTSRLLTPSFAGLTASVEMENATQWIVTVRSRIALRYACLEIPGWRPAVNCFHLAPGIDQRVSLTRETEFTGSAPSPRGRVSSIDATDFAVVSPGPAS